VTKQLIASVLLAFTVGCEGVTAWESEPTTVARADAGKADDESYMPVVIDEEFETTRKRDIAEKASYAARHHELLQRRYDLSDKPSDELMSGGRKAVQQGVRVKLPPDTSWQRLAELTPDEIKTRNLFPMGLRPLPHAKHAVGGMVFPEAQIAATRDAEGRDLLRFDVNFDLPSHLTPEFPPPLFLTTRPDLGDVSGGQILTIKNYYALMKGRLTPVQMEGLRLLLTPFPQQQFNQTEDRKVDSPSWGVSCLDCHTNGHTNATFHLSPDVRPQAARPRIETVSLRGVYNQQIHGSKRSLRSIEDFTEFEQRTAYFDGDHVIAAKKGAHLPDRASQVVLMAQMQSIIDFPPAPKLDVFGKLIPAAATDLELRGEVIFHGQGRCAECHPAPAFLDNQMHDLQLQRFYDSEVIGGHHNLADGPMKTFTLRGIKDSPPYLHDGRLLTLDDAVEFFNLVLSTKLTDLEKESLVAYLRCL
jgi:cytochrome c peroxidase